MDAASVNNHVLGKETTNYARLCRLLVDGGTKVFRGIFDKIHPPESLYHTLSTHRAFLESLYTGNQRILNREQWRKLFPSTPSIVSSQNFDITLLTLLLRNISGLRPPDTGWNTLPPATDTSTEADIIRVKYWRNEVYGHDSRAFVHDLMFDRYWQDIQQTLIRLGGKRYGPVINTLKVEYMDPDVAPRYRELLKQWIEEDGKIDQIEGTVVYNVGYFYAKAEEISLHHPSVGFRSSSKQWTGMAILGKVRRVFRNLQSLGKPKAAAACGAKETLLNMELNSHEVSAKSSTNRITSEMFHIEDIRTPNKAVVAWLEETINLQQSGHVAGAREKLQCVFRIVKDLKERFLSNPSKDGLRELRPWKKLFLEDSVSCSVKHGTLLLDSSNSEPQFYSSLLNVIGAFAVVISEFKIAKETFSMLTNFHRKSTETSCKRDLGAAHNNTGCISLILGEFEQAEHDFKTSVEHLESAELHNPFLETMSIAVNSNIGRLHQLSGNYSKALEKQEQLVECCKIKEVKELPLQVVFTLLNNLAVLCTTLGKFSKAEQELKWMLSYCSEMNTEDCEFLQNFVALHLSEVFLIHGKPKEAEKSFRLDDDIEMLGGLHINVRIETVEKLVDVSVLKGKIRFTCELLERSARIIENIFGTDHFNVALLLYKQGTILTLAGEISNAEEKFKSSIEILEEIFGEKHPLLLKCYMSLGELALRSKRADESYFYFKRAMENIEAMYQVSFENQLSRTYLEMTSSNTFHQSKMVEDATKIEGLVAEHGVALAVLLSRPVVQDDILSKSKTKLTQPPSTNNRDVQCQDSKEIVSFKYTSDFLQTGQTFLRQGMRKEAAAFFQQARKYSRALDATQGPAYACVARLYDVLTKKRLGNSQTLENKHEMSSCLEELYEVSAKIGNCNTCKGSTEEATKTTTTVATATATTTATTTATSDDQLNLKLVLIFLIVLSIELKMIDTTFAAHDLYCRISQNEDGLLHVLNGEVQFYASKTSITCNGKTALQDVLVSTVGLNENEFQRPPADKELYRSLAFKKNVPIDSFLVAYTSCVCLDIEEMRALDRKISLSVQECFQQKCLETGGEDSATQVIVDLTTTTSTRDHRNVLLTGSRMQLLSLCLLQGTTSEIPQGENISEISTATYLKTVRLTFEEEHTSHFIFSKIAPHLLEQCNSVKISTLSVQHHCLSLTITHPIKARLTLWRKDRSISQKVQFVQTATQLHGLADRAVPWQRCTGALLKDVGLAERIFWPAIDHLANAYRVPYITDVEHSNEPSSVSDLHCEQSGFPLDGQQPKERQFLSLTMEQSESLRNNFNSTILEGLTCISELSSQLYGDTIHEGDDDIVADADADADTEDISCLPTSSTSQFEEEVTSSDCHLQRSTLNPEITIQSQNLLFETQDLSGEEVTPETRETYPMPREKEDDNLLGRSLFEKERDSRRSLIIELHHKITKKSNLLNEQDGPSGELTQQVDNSAIDLQNAGKSHMTSSPNHLTSMDNSFPKGTSNSDTEPEVRNQNLMEPQSKQGPKDEGNTLEKHLIGASIAKVSDPKMEEILVKWNENVRENEDSAEDQGFYEKQQFERLPIPGQSTRKPKDEATQSFTDVTMDDLKNHEGTGNTKSDHQYRSNSLFSDPGQTQHLHDVQRKTMHTIPEEEKDKTISPVKIGEGYMLQGRDERESSDGQHEQLVNEDFSQAFTPATMKKRETSRSSFKFFDDTVPDGPVTGNSNGIQNSWIDSMSSRSTDVVDGPLKRPGNNLPVQSVILPENAAAILTSQSERNEKLRPTLQNRKETSFQNPQLGFLSYNVLADGGTIDFLIKEDEIVDGPILTGEAFKTYQDVSICENQKASFPLNAARDKVDAGVYSPQNEANVKDPPGFGGARPKQISRNSTIRYSSTKQKITEPISTCQHNETGEFGLEPGFLERHTVRSNGAILDLHPQDGLDEPYFSARAFKDITYGDNLRLPGEGINLPGYTPSSSSQGLYAQECFAATTSKRGDAQSLAIHQKPSLNQKESWHFPSLESPVLQRNFSGDQGLCASQQSASQSGNSIISNALFGSRRTGTAYDETDSVVNGYNHIGNVDNRLVKSPAVSDGHLSSAQDSMSSLLGNLQQIMSKTVNLIASSNAVAKQPKEAVKLSIQEEARGSREQEQAVRVEEESAQGHEETERQPIPTPVQETPRPVCSHYQRRCLVRFPCCGKFYPCHRCHNESKDCSDVPARATNATHMRCSICYHEQEIDEQSQNCSGCKSKMSDYFCATCKHFTSVEKNPFHCDKCGICRIHRDRSFHCDVCNVCLDKRLQGKHKCRPDSGHDECCICLEDAFSGCQILPCSHKVHKDCAILMIQNGLRKCPICRHPLFSQPQNSPQ